MTTTPSNFEQPVLLRQSQVWSRTISWGIIGFTSFTLIWAAVFQIEEAVPAVGKLEPQGSVSEIQAPVSGVVQTVYVKDGQRVKKGDLLLRLDATTAQAQTTSLQKVRSALVQENAFYRSQLAGAAAPGVTALNIPPEMAALTKSRAAIAAETQLYRTQLVGAAAGALTPEQQLRLRARQVELGSRLASAQLEAGQAGQQLRQTQVKLVTARQTLQINQQILNDMQPLIKEGAISRVQFSKQQQEVLTRRSEVEQLTEEQQRLIFEVAKNRESFRNTAAGSQEDLLAKITANEKGLAEIDGQVTKVILENQKKIAEIDGQLSQAQQTLQYQELRAPTSGTVFELKAHGSGYVANPSDPVLKIVPEENLIAEVYITNKDIGFVKEGMEADVRIDSFPFHEYGDIKGELSWVGSDALPPDQIRNYYHFPAKIRLNRQTLLINNRELPLQSGMSVSTNIKLRKRTILSIFTDLFMKQVESLKFVR